MPVSSGRARHAKQLALAAFSDYAHVGADWARAGRARVAHQTITATRDGRLGTTLALRANELLIAAGKLLG